MKKNKSLIIDQKDKLITRILVIGDHFTGKTTFL